MTHSSDFGHVVLFSEQPQDLLVAFCRSGHLGYSVIFSKLVLVLLKLHETYEQLHQRNSIQATSPLSAQVILSSFEGRLTLYPPVPPGHARTSLVVASRLTGLKPVL
jgi:hypothetical protein